MRGDVLLANLRYSAQVSARFSAIHFTKCVVLLKGVGLLSVFSKSRRIRRRVIFRWALVVLPVAFLISQVRPVEGISTGLLIGGIVILLLLPFLLIHAWMGLRKNRRKVRSLSSTAYSSAIFDNEGDRTEIASVDRVDTAREKASVPSNGVERAGSDDRAVISDAAMDSDAVSGTVVNAPMDNRCHDVDAVVNIDDWESEVVDLDGTLITPEDIQDQLDQVGDVVQTHDLDEEDMHQQDDARILRERQQRDQLADAGTSLITATSHADIADLSELTHQEVTQLVSILKKDKLRLHRLVLAQKAAIDSERRAHDRSRTVARDAIKIMRHSRESQKQAEKLARRERTQRKRLELEYKKVSTALDNARSIIETRKNETA